MKSKDSVDLLLRRSILLQLESASPASLPTDTILAGLKISGIEADDVLLEKALDYLMQKKLVDISSSLICASHRRAKLTAQGRDYLESGAF